jgi:membrane protein implicated in regulation of membrane protease activity
MRADDRGGGLALLIVFTTAVLITTGTVALLALVGTWWMLGVAFAVLAGMTAVVVLTILDLIDGHGRATANRDRRSRAENRRLEDRPQLRREPRTAP